VPRKNKAGGKPPQGPRVDQRQLEAIAEALEAAKPDFAKAMGLSPDEFHRLWEDMRQCQKFMDAAYPPELKQQFEAMERKQRAKRAAEAEAAAQKAAKQAWRARRKGIGGRHPAMTPTEIEAAKEELRGHPELHTKKDAAIKHLQKRFEGQGKTVSRGSLQRDVIWPVLGREKRR
jgi:hypothetical protein